MAVEGLASAGGWSQKLLMKKSVSLARATAMTLAIQTSDPQGSSVTQILAQQPLRNVQSRQVELNSDQME